MVELANNDIKRALKYAKGIKGKHEHSEEINENNQKTNGASKEEKYQYLK